MTYEPVIGLEVHIQLNTKSKMFCSSPNVDADRPNKHICEICTGQPGVLPVINKEAVKKAVMLGLALNCDVAEYSRFDRKNYFYPDLPKGYQISQFDMPINGKGKFEFDFEGKIKTVGITRAHLEEDAGKLVHPVNANYSLVDYNRTGVPLVEIVSDPDIESPEEARVYLQELQNLAWYLGVSEADMEKGHMRCDANISLNKSGEKGFPPYKVEVKNLNSFKAVVAALSFEIKRQSQILDEGKTPANETRGWVEAKGETVSQRSKEESYDYRYFPEPDLPVLNLPKEWVEHIRRDLPELPAQRKNRFKSEYFLKDKDAATLVMNKEVADYFEQVVSELEDWLKADGKDYGPTEDKAHIKLAANWCLGPFMSKINEAKITPGESRITQENFAELIKLIIEGKVSQLAAKDVLTQMFETGEDPSNLLESMGLLQISDAGQIEAAVKKVLVENHKAVEDAKVKGERAFGFLVGQIMKVLGGKGNPKVINEILKKELEKE